MMRLAFAGLMLLLLGCSPEVPHLPDGVDGESRLAASESPWLDRMRIVAGHRHACLSRQGQVICWGDDDQGQTRVPDGLRHVTDLAAGEAHTCALDEGRVQCWGSDRFGQTRVPADLPPVVALAAGNAHTCALDSDGRVFCWGRNQESQSRVPADLPAVELLVAEGHQTCVSTGLNVQCWGGLAAPDEVRLLDDWSNGVSLSVDRSQICAVRFGGVHCRDSRSLETRLPPPLLEPVRVRAGGDYRCAVVLGRVDCWQGSERLDKPRMPATEVRDVAVTQDYGCLLTSDDVRCWAWSDSPADWAVLQPPVLSSEEG